MPFFAGSAGCTTRHRLFAGIHGKVRANFILRFSWPEGLRPYLPASIRYVNRSAR